MEIQADRLGSYLFTASMFREGLVLQGNTTKAYYCFNTVVERSNPLIMRQFYMPQDSPVEDLAAAGCIFMGIEPTPAEMYISGIKINAKDKNRRIGELIHEKDEISMLLMHGSQKRGAGTDGLRIFARVVDMPESDAKNHPSDPSGIPYADMVVGMNIPAGIVNIGELNEIQSALSDSEYYDKGGGSYYSRKELLYSTKKTENAIRKYFAPETAEKEINMKLGMPMELLLEKLKVNSLKYIADNCNMYYDSTFRKPDLVGGLCNRLGGRNISNIFEDMNISEFILFKRLVLSETPEDEKWEYMLNELNKRGLIQTIPKIGLRVASEVLEYYEGWYSTERETAFIYGKYCQEAFLLAARLYGIFNREQFQYVLETMFPGKVPEDRAAECYKSFIGYPGKGALLTRGMVYMQELLNQRDAEALNKRLYTDTTLFYRPAKKELLALSENPYYISKTGLNELKVLMEKYAYYGYYEYEYGNGIERSCYKVVSELHKAGDTEAAVRIAEGEMRRLSWSKDREEILEKVRQLLRKDADKIPVIALKGYSYSNCPKEILDHMTKIKNKATAETGNGKRKAAPARKKTVAVSKRR